MKKKVTHLEIKEKLSELPGWSFSNDQLKKSYLFKDFREAMGFLIAISYQAERLDHHPGIYNCFNRVEITLNTHDADNRVTEKDFKLARAIESVL
jgi:4a-hydroxytetrahydrobiopterin dehydratase